MKTLLSLMVLFLSAKSMAHTCHIALYDYYNRPVLNFQSTNDYNCQAAANQCYSSIRTNNLNPNYYKCYTISMTNDPVARPQQSYPAQLPPREVRVPNTETIDPSDTEYIRDIESGETVIYQEKLHVVTDAHQGVYSLKPQDGKKSDIVDNVNRELISITRGCLRGICTKTAVISKSAQKMMPVEGISANGTYVLRDVTDKDKKLVMDVRMADLVPMKGCAKDAYAEACVGNTVTGRDGQNYEVVGIQSSNTVVLKDVRQRLYFNVSVRTITVIR